MRTTTQLVPKRAQERLEPIAGSAIVRVPTPLRRIDLKTLKQVRSEMSRVYREVRDNKIDSYEGARLVYMLSQIGKMIELAELELRLARLEEAANHVRS